MIATGRRLACAVGVGRAARRTAGAMTVVDWQLQLSAGSEQHAPVAELGVGSPQHADDAAAGVAAADEEQQLLVFPALGRSAF